MSSRLVFEVMWLSQPCSSISRSRSSTPQQNWRRCCEQLEVECIQLRP